MKLDTSPHTHNHTSVRIHTRRICSHTHVHHTHTHSVRLPQSCCSRAGAARYRQHPDANGLTYIYVRAHIILGRTLIRNLVYDNPHNTKSTRSSKRHCTLFLTKHESLAQQYTSKTPLTSSFQRYMAIMAELSTH